MGIVGIHALKAPRAGRRLLLQHYPEMAAKLHGHTFDLILAGHSHGGQVRLPFYGALFLPWGVGSYDMGLFRDLGRSALRERRHRNLRGAVPIQLSARDHSRHDVAVALARHEYLAEPLRFACDAATV